MSETRKGENQKLKLLYLYKIFFEETDDEHALTMPEIIEKLADYGVNADRKTLYQDFEELRNFGYDIISEKTGRNTYYYLGARDFELAELKLLVDSVQSSKFITDKKSNELIGKLESLASNYDGKKLQRQVVISGRVKTMNESIYYNVDKLHEAIGANSRIKFQYTNWNLNKELELRRGGSWYEISPWALMWDDENYYLVAYDKTDDAIKHFRVDKMQRITVTGEKREGQDQFRKFDMPRYTKTLFGMFGGEERRVVLEATNDMVGILIDRFGKDIIIAPAGPGRFQTTVTVAISKQFLGWIVALGERIRIAAPDDIVALMREESERLAKEYGVI